MEEFGRCFKGGRNYSLTSHNENSLNDVLAFNYSYIKYQMYEYRLLIQDTRGPI